jgi:uncharacterized membrane protein
MSKQLLRGRILGHPIHVMLVHFPLALFPVGLLFDALAYLKEDTSLATVGFYAMGCGLAGALAAAVFGGIDFLNLPVEKTIQKKAMIHAALNVSAVCIYTVLFAIRYKSFPQINLPGLTEILINSLTVAIVLVGAHLGGELIFRHQIGFIQEKERTVIKNGQQ